jgi:hypothetical protein
MSTPDEPPRDTIPAPALATPEPIAAGRAQLAVSLALAKVAREHAALEGAILELDAIAMACARALDATAGR